MKSFGWVLLSALAGSAAAAPPPPSAPVTLVKVLVDMPAGSQYPLANAVTGCVNGTYPGGRGLVMLPPYLAAFRTAMEAAGLKTQTPGVDNIFDSAPAPADLELAAIIRSEKAEACAKPPSATGGMFESGDRWRRAHMSMAVDWQLYSSSRKEVLARVSTSADFSPQTNTEAVLVGLVTGAFAANVRELSKNPDFTKVLAAQPASAGDVISPDNQKAIVLSGSLKAASHPVEETAGQLVVVTTSGGSGSGVLVSDDGYILTDAHVVGSLGEVRLRWSDGLETVGKVVRVSKTRDVALIKTDGRGRPPVPLRKGPVTPGAPVFAIGSPLGERFQGSVSRGVISGSRIIDGLSFLQSDVSVAPGSSGGALIDADGNLIGLAVGQYRAGTMTSGVNMFIPISDALAFLSLTPG